MKYMHNTYTCSTLSPGQGGLLADGRPIHLHLLTACCAAGGGGVVARTQGLRCPPRNYSNRFTLGRTAPERRSSRSK